MPGPEVTSYATEIPSPARNVTGSGHKQDLRPCVYQVCPHLVPYSVQWPERAGMRTRLQSFKDSVFLAPDLSSAIPI